MADAGSAAASDKASAAPIDLFFLEDKVLMLLGLDLEH
jgi:hypothetical protein